jgi:hypothetical protein
MRKPRDGRPVKEGSETYWIQYRIKVSCNSLSWSTARRLTVSRRRKRQRGATNYWSLDVRDNGRNKWVLGNNS